MSKDSSRINAGTASVGLAACMLLLHGILLVLVLLPERWLSEAVLSVIRTMGVVSFFSFLAIPLPPVLGVIGLVRGGRQRTWGLMGLSLTALTLLVGYFAQAGIWKP